MISEILSADTEVLYSLLIFFRRNCNDYCDSIINQLLDIFFEFTHYTKLKWDILHYHAYFLILFERYFNKKPPVDISLTLPHLLKFFIQFYRDPSFTKNPTVIFAINSTIEYFAHLFILQKPDSELIPKFLILFNCILFKPSTLLRLLKRGYCTESKNKKIITNNSSGEGINNVNTVAGGGVTIAGTNSIATTTNTASGSTTPSTTTITTTATATTADHHNHTSCTNICFVYFLSQFLTTNFVYQVKYLSTMLIKTIIQLACEDEKYNLVDLIPLKSLLNILWYNKQYVINQYILHIINERLDFGKMPLSSSLINEKYKWKGVYYNPKMKSKRMYIISADNVLYIYPVGGASSGNDTSSETDCYDVLPLIKMFLYNVETKKIDGGIELRWKMEGISKSQDLTIYINNEKDLYNCWNIINDIVKSII